MRTALLFTISAVSLVAAAAQAQTGPQLQAERQAELAHEGRLRSEVKGNELHREHLHQQLAAAQKSGDKAAISRIRAELAQDYTAEKNEKAMSMKDTIADRKLGIDPSSHR